MPYVEYDEVEAVCAECGMTFRSEEALEGHRIQVHLPARPTSGSNPTRPEPLRCGACEQLFNTPAAFRDHQRIVHHR
ncbi:MAG: C2H2-type zinc finger protein [Thermoplasmata archaeon]|nr:C2H2-type zinc finger protein [Thermoplasmata archaeon]